MTQATHKTVLLAEAIGALQVQKGKWYVDATLGGGGHTQAILDAGGKVIALDFDESAVAKARERFASALQSGSLILIRENFDKLARLLSDYAADTPIQGVLFDFGTSTDQLMDQSRGLSFENPDAQLDMRMDDRLGVKASDLLKLLSTKQLAEVFRDFGGEEHAKSIAKRIGTIREKNPAQLETVGALLAIVAQSKPYKRGHLNPATKVFQALRITVNDELDNIFRALPQALEAVQPGGRIVTIAFHEGEDRLAKQAFAQWEKEGRGARITPKPLQPSAEELRANPRSRSAKMRVFERNIV